MYSLNMKPIEVYRKKPTTKQCDNLVDELGTVYLKYLLQNSSFSVRIEIYEDIQRLFKNYRGYLKYWHIAKLMGVPTDVVIYDFIRMNVDLEYLKVTIPETFDKYMTFCEENLDYFRDNYFFSDNPKKQQEICEELNISIDYFCRCMYLYYREYGYGDNAKQIKRGLHLFFGNNTVSYSTKHKDFYYISKNKGYLGDFVWESDIKQYWYMRNKFVGGVGFPTEEVVE